MRERAAAPSLCVTLWCLIFAVLPSQNNFSSFFRNKLRMDTLYIDGMVGVYERSIIPLPGF